MHPLQSAGALIEHVLVEPDQCPSLQHRFWWNPRLRNPTSSSRSRSSWASVRSVLARHFGPRRVAVSADSATWDSNPGADCVGQQPLSIWHRRAALAVAVPNDLSRVRGASPRATLIRLRSQQQPLTDCLQNRERSISCPVHPSTPSPTGLGHRRRSGDPDNAKTESPGCSNGITPVRDAGQITINRTTFINRCVEAVEIPTKCQDLVR